MNSFQCIHNPKWKIYRRFSLGLSLSASWMFSSFNTENLVFVSFHRCPKTMLTDSRSSLLPSWSERPVAIRQTIWLSYIVETCVFNINCCDVNAVYSITYHPNKQIFTCVRCIRCCCWWTVFTTFLSAFLSSVSLFRFPCCGSCLCLNTIYVQHTCCITFCPKCIWANVQQAH